jgi:hypothetical protein
MAMTTRTTQFLSFGSMAAVAVVIAALTAGASSVAMAGAATPNHGIFAARKKISVTDISAARRRYSARRRAFDRFDGGGGYVVPTYRGGYPGFGYGVHDNSGPRSSG